MFGRWRQLRERIEVLERAQETAKLQWEELLDQVHRWMQRTRARERRDQEAAAPAPADPLAGLDPVSRAIHERRKSTERKLISGSEE